ncbi:MAG TPA: hypothetical protein VHC49_19310 [Mycobacteriales bacterium]|nr:hypothetical protein [Mycobacteriales bacterium]
MTVQPELAAEHPTAVLARKVAESPAGMHFRVGRPQEPNWFALAEIAQRPLLDQWLDQLPAARAGLRNVAAANIALKLTMCLARPLMVALHAERRFPALTGADVFVHRQSDGRFDELALAETSVWAVRPEPGEVPVGAAELIAIAADCIFGVLGPVLEALRSSGRYGLKGLWGGTQDMLGATSLLVARRADLPQWIVWRDVEALLDQLSERVSHAKVRPQPFSVPCSRGEAVFTVKGTCCLRYREQGLRPSDHARAASAFCHTCPFVDEGTRRRHFTEKVAREDNG